MAKLNIDLLDKEIRRPLVPEPTEHEAYGAMIHRGKVETAGPADAATGPTTTSALLSERGKTHGDFKIHAAATQAIKACMLSVHKITPASDTPIPAWETLSPTQRESLEMIAHKIGRILAGNPNFKDHWDDIAGYAKLVADECK